VSDLRKFRSSVATLKKRGLLPARTSSGQPLDARSAQPSWKTLNGRTLASQVKKYDDVISGKVTPLKVSPERLKQFRKAGYEVSNDRVLIPHSSVEVARIEKGEVVIKSASGIERVQIPIAFHNLDQYLRDIAADRDKINRMKTRNEYFGFRFYGNNSSSLYSDIAHAIEDLAKYDSVMTATTRLKQRDIYKNLEIVRVNRNAGWVFPSERRKESSKKYNRERMKRFRAKLKRKPKFIQEQYRQNKIERQKAYRARIRADRQSLQSCCTKTCCKISQETHQEKADQPPCEK
jgi:hypothetical protein